MIYIVKNLCRVNGLKEKDVRAELNNYGYTNIETVSKVADVPSGCMYHDGVSIKKKK